MLRRQKGVIIPVGLSLCNRLYWGYSKCNAFWS